MLYMVLLLRKGINGITHQWTTDYTIPNIHARYDHWLTSVMKVIWAKNFLIRSESYKIYAWYYKPDQKSVAQEVKGPRGNPNIVVLLNEYVDRLPSKYSCLYSQSSAALYHISCLLLYAAIPETQTSDSNIFIPKCRVFINSWKYQGTLRKKEKIEWNFREWVGMSWNAVILTWPLQ